MVGPVASWHRGTNSDAEYVKSKDNYPPSSMAVTPTDERPAPHVTRSRTTRGVARGTSWATCLLGELDGRSERCVTAEPVREGTAPRRGPGGQPEPGGSVADRVVEHDHLDQQVLLAQREQLTSMMARPPSPDSVTTWRAGWAAFTAIARGRVLAIEP